MNMNKKRIIIATAVAAAAVAAAAYLAMSGGGGHNMAVETAVVAEGDISNSVTATGTIEPVTSVDVGTQVSGIVANIYADYNSVVKKGQVIAELDKTNLISQVNTAKAALNNAQSQLAYQKANYGRYKTLYDKGLVSADEHETALLAYRQAQDEVKQRRESLQQAQTNLGYATITSPVDGVVLSREVEEGQTVAASFETPTLFTIAQDLTNMRVIADVDEADIGEVKEGERVTFTVDAYPDDTFDGTVTQVRQEGNTEDNVVTYEVVISAPNKDLKLKPGLTASVTIYTLDKRGVTCVPNKALRFTPTQELAGGEVRINDCKGENKVWTFDNGVFTAHVVTVGISDGVNTELLGGIAKGAMIVTGMKPSADGRPNDADTAEESNPFAPKGPGQGKKNKK